MMRYAVLLVLLLSIPVAAGAQGMMYPGGQPMGPGMMSRVEEGALGEDLHEEMEDLMVKMMTGNLTSAEEARLVALMKENPGPYGMMLSRMMYGSYQAGGYSPAGGGMMMGGSMMDGWAGTAIWGLGILIVIDLVVWLIAGVFFIQWLSRQTGRA